MMTLCCHDLIVCVIHSFIMTDLSDNEMAKAHLRHLAGGRHSGSLSIGIKPSSSKISELLYRFEFPEAPGALAKFLYTMNHFNEGWSISIFHYRNHGHDFGRVLIAMLVREDEIPAFKVFLQKLNYTHYNESGNEAYRQFML
jgi:threonine dehydratase